MADSQENLSTIFTVNQSNGSANLLADFFALPYRTPYQIESSTLVNPETGAASGEVDRVWGGILCIDPNGLRSDNKGPIYYLLDTITISPGLTEAAGAFTATINDNKTGKDADGNRIRSYNMTLFKPGNPFIRDNDEFWIGVQQGGSTPNNKQGRTNDWTSSGGGRYWFMGGWISDRRYEIDEEGRVTAHLEGKSYMELWMDNYFGTADDPRNYEDGADLAQIISDVLDDLNEAQEIATEATDEAFTADNGVWVQLDNEEINEDSETVTGQALDESFVSPDVLAPDTWINLDKDGLESGSEIVTDQAGTTIYTKGTDYDMDYEDGKIAPLPAGTMAVTTTYLIDYRWNPDADTDYEMRYYSGYIKTLGSGDIDDGEDYTISYTYQSKDYNFSRYHPYYPSYALTADASYGDTVLAVESTDGLTTGEARIWDDEKPEGETFTIDAVHANLLTVDISGGSGPGGGLESLEDYTVLDHAKIMMTSDETGVILNKEFKAPDCFTVMRDLCDQADYELPSGAMSGGLEWRIIPYPSGSTPADRRKVMVYPRNNAPASDQPLIEFSRNIRRVPELVMGDTSSLVTSLIVEGEQETIPPNRMAWIEPGLWPDVNWTNRKYTMLSVPAPPNAKTGSYCDASQVLDDEGWPAINFQKTELGGGQFWVYLSFYTDEGGEPIAGNMNINLRKWRRLRFKIKHNSRAEEDEGTEYYVGLHTLKTTGSGAGASRFNHYYRYQFGTGEQQDSPDFNEPTVSDADTVIDSEWTEINLLLPEVDSDGSISDAHGWTTVGEPDPTEIDFLAFQIYCDEDEPGKSVADNPAWTTGNTPPRLHDMSFVDRIPLQSNVSVGDEHFELANPYEVFGAPSSGAPATLSGEQAFYNPKPRHILGDPNSWEWVEIDAIWKNGDYPGSNNVHISPGSPTGYPVKNNYTGSHKYLYIVGGWSISLSQIRFERNVLFEKQQSDMASNLQYPRRFRRVDYNEIEFTSEAEARADQELLQLGHVIQSVDVEVDGDPRQRIGMRVTPRFDPQRSAAGKSNLIFHNVSMIIEDIKHVVVGTDFYSIITLNVTDSRGRRLNETRILSRHQEKLRRNARGIIPNTKGILQIR